ncbi:hypothetical protein K432DRAFT_307160 [Lepidopterella palustris CBS 459.81]|uniref:Uncharacterized protein n=1 Tax=Lepidopterella palustris CBS 459.81 TaxID=1314670 RepID=A0A8E2E2K6_9PEZI|nr:hypothetical protein K432DRAFT_307160 [Lepidopterella palustris CBS 459.81]
MAVVRDPAFWRRFSMAVHRDEEAHNSWLARQNQKRSRRTCICWIFWLCFFGLVAGLVITILWLKSAGILK